MSYLRYGITTGRSFKNIHRRKQRTIKVKIHKIIADDVIKFRLDIRKTFRKKLNVKAYENAVGKQKTPVENPYGLGFTNLLLFTEHLVISP